MRADGTKEVAAALKKGGFLDGHRSLCWLTSYTSYAWGGRWRGANPFKREANLGVRKMLKRRFSALKCASRFMGLVITARTHGLIETPNAQRLRSTLY